MKAISRSQCWSTETHCSSLTGLQAFQTSVAIEPRVGRVACDNATCAIPKEPWVCAVARIRACCVFTHVSFGSFAMSYVISKRRRIPLHPFDTHMLQQSFLQTASSSVATKRGGKSRVFFSLWCLSCRIRWIHRLPTLIEVLQAFGLVSLPMESCRPDFFWRFSHIKLWIARVAVHEYSHDFCDIYLDTFVMELLNSAQIFIRLSWGRKG